MPRLTKNQTAELRSQITSLAAILAEHCEERYLEVTKVQMLSAVATGTHFKPSIKLPAWIRKEPIWVRRMIRDCRNATWLSEFKKGRKLRTARRRPAKV
jgi:hypothetical protein